MTVSAPFTSWYVGDNRLRMANYYMSGNVSFNAPAISTCQASNVTVPMKSWAIRNMGAVGSTGPAQGFSVALSNCANNITSIAIRFTPSTAVLATGSSDFALNSVGAQGVGIRLMDGGGAAVPLNTDRSMPFSAGSTSASLAMQAAYVRSSPTVLPGVANGSLVFTMSYR